MINSKIKGTTPPNFPKSWKKWVYVNEDDTEEVKIEKYKYNSLVVNKKPYFFIYLYKHLMKDYNTYKKSFDKISQRYFGLTIKKLIAKPDKNSDEMNLVRQYQKFSPVLETNCVMNILCKYIESCDFDIKFNPNTKSILPSFKGNSEINEDYLLQIMEIYHEYKTKKHFNIKTMFVDDDIMDDSDLEGILNTIYTEVKEDCINKCSLVCENQNILFDHLIELYEKNKINMDFIWDMMDDCILDMIPYNNPVIAIQSVEGENYLGTKINIVPIEYTKEG